ncbi:hypothetical protein GOP47_0000167 [Adiantum capillus-veneris]|uniref:phosphatidylserine decarboxylase n=1 Tax=Adiantum capillus-veneris TaxID=13818 RepID=A0A9D4VD23_ADICA|nr:hypothetical protein GOP47_0000167 [Adiantum capillus-veneris]
MGQKVSTGRSRHGKNTEREASVSSRGKIGADEPSSAPRNKTYSGIIRIRIEQAEMQFKDRWFACLSLGQQTFRTATSSNTDRPVWRSEKKIALEENGARIARISVFETNRLSKNNLVGYCELDLSDALNSGPDYKDKLLELYDPSTKAKIVGTISLGYTIEDRLETERSFARRLLSIMDADESGELSLQEFRELIKAFGNKVSTREIENLFIEADTNGDGKVSADELAQLLAEYQEKSGLMNRCPVCGENLGQSSSVDDVIHVSLCFDEGSGYETMTGGFLTEKQASYGWMFKLSEWAHISSYDIGLKEGSKSSHILVFDRRTMRLEEELIDNKIVLAMRAIYQSRMGLALVDKGTKELLVNMSIKQGLHMSSLESAKEIPKFIEFFQDRINVDEFKYPVESYKTFNEFFIRELKPGARQIMCEDKPHVAVCAADCRLMVYKSVDEAKRFWIKGRKFSVKGLLGDEVLANDFEGGSLAIFRLAPQDYHRFHMPVNGEIGKNIMIPGHLYTVNPIAVNSKYCDVFTDNKRVVNVIISKEFGKVAFVAIGATMVGSINFTKNEKDRVKKGDEFGYFSFGGSTVICVFQKTLYSKKQV